MTAALWFGDGIIAADPVRAIILSSDGVLLAASPVASSFVLLCASDALFDCVFYDDLARIICTPRLAGENFGFRLMANGRPQYYPEGFRGMLFGFDARPTTLAQALSLEARSMVRNPAPSAIAILWWAGIAGLAIPRLGTRRTRKAWAAVAVGALRICVAGLMIALVVLARQLGNPYSTIYFGLVAGIGVALAIGAKLAFRRRSPDKRAAYAPKG